jgi:hypothetical protein
VGYGMATRDTKAESYHFRQTTGTQEMTHPNDNTSPEAFIKQIPRDKAGTCRLKRPFSASTYKVRALGLCIVKCYLLSSRKSQRQVPMGLVRHDQVKRRRVCNTARLLNNRGTI